MTMDQLASVVFSAGVSLVLLWLAVRIHRTTSKRWRWRWLGGMWSYPWPRDVSQRESVSVQVIASALFFLVAAVLIVWFVRTNF